MVHVLHMYNIERLFLSMLRYTAKHQLWKRIYGLTDRNMSGRFRDATLIV